MVDDGGEDGRAHDGDDTQNNQDVAPIEDQVGASLIVEVQVEKDTQDDGDESQCAKDPLTDVKLTVHDYYWLFFVVFDEDIHEANGSIFHVAGDLFDF